MPRTDNGLWGGDESPPAGCREVALRPPCAALAADRLPVADRGCPPWAPRSPPFPRPARPRIASAARRNRQNAGITDRQPRIAEWHPRGKIGAEARQSTSLSDPPALARLRAPLGGPSRPDRRVPAVRDDGGRLTPRGADLFWFGENPRKNKGFGDSSPPAPLWRRARRPPTRDGCGSAARLSSHGYAGRIPVRPGARGAASGAWAPRPPGRAGRCRGASILRVAGKRYVAARALQLT